MADPNEVQMQWKHGPVGSCIYCGASDVHLTDEHIIPFSLGGLLELTQASCLSCAKDTGKVEGYVGRTLWGNTRMRLGFPTRRKKDRPATIPITAITSDGEAQMHLPVGDYPACAPMIWMPRAGALAGFYGPHFQVRIFMADSSAAAGVRLKGEGQIDFGKYARFLAKVAHGFATLLLGTDGFKPVLSPLILGDPKAITFQYVGGSLATQPPDQGAQLHTARIELVSVPTGDWVVIHLRLFCTLGQRCPEGLVGTPTYEVVVGRQNELTRARRESIPYY